MSKEIKIGEETATEEEILKCDEELVNILSHMRVIRCDCLTRYEAWRFEIYGCIDGKVNTSIKIVADRPSETGMSLFEKIDKRVAEIKIMDEEEVRKFEEETRKNLE